MRKFQVGDSLLASSARTTSGQTSGHAVEDAMAIDFAVIVTAVSGTNPTLDVAIQTAAEHDVADANWITVANFTQITATGNYGETISIYLGDAMRKHVRLSYTIDGTTPSFTFSARMNKHVFIR